MNLHDWTRVDAGEVPAAYLQHPRVGESAPAELPLFLSAGSYVPLTFAAAYASAFDGEPDHIQRAVEVRPDHIA